MSNNNSRIRAVTFALTVVAAAGLAAPALAQSPASGAGCQLPSGLLHPADLPANASATACNAVGRAIEHDNIVLHVPAPGTAASGEAESPDGGTEFVMATAADGTVSYPETDSGLLPGGSVSGPGPCSDGAYNLLFGYGGNVEWYLGDGVRPAYLTTSQTADVLNEPSRV